MENPVHPEHLKHPCLSGHLVRSKSELLIDQALFTHQIPFRYECALKLNDLTLYPDFTIRHPETGQFFYWEHFGMMDSPTYSQNAILCPNLKHRAIRKYELQSNRKVQPPKPAPSY